MKKTIATTIISAMTLFASADVQTAKVSDKLKALWDDPVLQEQLDTGIKANRMSDFFLKFIVHFLKNPKQFLFFLCRYFPGLRFFRVTIIKRVAT